MTKKAAALVQAFTALSLRERAEVIDLIAEYYLARPKHRHAVLQKAGMESVTAQVNSPTPPARTKRQSNF